MATPQIPSQADAQRPQPQGNGVAIAGMVLGILTIVLFFTSVIALVLGVLGLVFSIVGIRKAARVGTGRGMAIAGLVTSIIGMILVLLMIVAIAIPAFMEYSKKSRSTEAGEQLNLIAKRAKLAFGENSEFPRGTASLTPSAECCSQPKATCTTSAADWNSPVWQALHVVMDGPTHYRYDYTSNDGKSFVAHAVGDTDCDGVPAVYELRGMVDASGEPSITLVKPPSGTY